MHYLRPTFGSQVHNSDIMDVFTHLLMEMKRDAPNVWRNASSLLGTVKYWGIRFELPGNDA